MPKFILTGLITLAFFVKGFAQTEPEKHLDSAKVFYAAAKYHEAIASCKKVTGIFRYRDAAYFIMAKSNMQLGIYTYAVNDFTESIRYDRNNAEALACRSYCYFRLKEYRQARHDLIEACVLDSSNALYHYNLGDVEQHMNKFSEAIKSYTQAIRINPYYVEAYKNRGHIYLSKQDFDLAIRDFDSALKYNQNSVELLLYRGMALVPIKHYKEAISMFNRCIRLNPTYAAAYYNRGRVRYEQRDFTNAIRDFDTAIVQDEQMEIAYFNRALARLEVDKKDKEEACNDIRKAISLGYTEALFYVKKFCE